MPQRHPSFLGVARALYLHVMAWRACALVARIDSGEIRPPSMHRQGSKKKMSSAVMPGQSTGRASSKSMFTPLSSPSEGAIPPAPDDNDDSMGSIRRPSAMQSAFMVRQAERAHLTGLSPIEEMRLAQNELRAKAAAQMVRRPRLKRNRPFR